jgi:phage terminase large subunit GpA-like protein
MTWPLADEPARHAIIRKSGIDCAYRPDTVRAFCRWISDVEIVPVRGDPSVKAFCRPTKISGPPRGDKMAKVAGASEIRYDLNVDAYKDRLWRMIGSETPGPGYLHLPADADEVLTKQLVAEKRIPIRDGRGRHRGWTWVLKKDKLPNHLLDCFDYAAAISDLAGARLIADPNAPPPGPRRRGVIDRFKQR